MKTQRPYPALTITPKGERALVDGHPWVYAGEVTQVPEGTEDGALVDVLSRKGSYLGTGFYNSRSMIRVRLLSRNANDRFDRAFWARRVQYAWDYRKTVMGEEDSRCCRIIFGEADHFPGLTVDRFENVLVAQVLSLGMDRIKPMIFGLLVETLRADGQEIAGVYERNDVALREKEGMEQGTSRKTASAIPWTLKTGRKRAFSSTRSITGSPWRSSRAGGRCSTASRTRVRSRSTPRAAGQSM